MRRKQVGCAQSNLSRNSPIAAVKHMASSLSVEWAKNGVRVNALRHWDFSLPLLIQLSHHHRISPGYMMTKLTRTILSNNPELKVTLFLRPPHSTSSWCLSENVGGFNADGKSKEIVVPSRLSGADLTQIFFFDRWGNQKISTCVVLCVLDFHK